MAGNYCVGAPRGRKSRMRNSWDCPFNENCIHIEERAAAAKLDVRRFTEHLMAVIKAKEKEIFNKVDTDTSKGISQTSANWTARFGQTSKVYRGRDWRNWNTFKAKHERRDCTGKQVIKHNLSGRSRWWRRTSALWPWRLSSIHFRSKRIINGENRHLRNRCFQNIYQQN